MRKIFIKITRIFTLLLAIVLVGQTFCFKNIVLADDNVKEITVFSVEDYICDDQSEGGTSVLKMFEEETGVHVNYLTFATNEEMYNELKKDPDSCDLMCPSEYMIMKLREEGMIRDFETPDNFKNFGSKYIKEVFKKYPLELLSEDEEKSYAVGYMWGTIGLIYNVSTIGDDVELLNSWDCLWDKAFSGKVTIKDSIRDTYIIALAEVYRDELINYKNKLDAGLITTEEYNKEITEIFNKADTLSVKKVEEALTRLKPNLYGFEVDAGKSDILTGKIDLNLAWSGDAVYSIEQGLYDEDGNELDEQVILGFAIPEEGSNVWFDGYVMTKNANYENALKFLDFIARPDVAVLNMDETGYTSCIVGEEVFEYVKECYHDDESENTVNLKYLFNPDCNDDSYVINVADELVYMFEAQYPSEEVLKRCVVMKNFSGDELERINDMWKKIRLTTLSDIAIIVITLSLVLVIIAVILFKNKDKLFKFEKGKIKDKKSKYKVIKREKIN